MRKYEHDTYYFGEDILRAIRQVVGKNPDIDRGGVYIWSVASDDNNNSSMIYLNLNENYYRGSLECYKNGSLKSQINRVGILLFNDDCTDYIFNANHIVEYLHRNI